MRLAYLLLLFLLFLPETLASTAAERTFPVPYSAVGIKGHYAYLTASDLGLTVLDVSNPAAPKPVATVTGDNPQGLAIGGDFAYVANGTQGLQIFDLSDPSKPLVLSTFKTSGSAVDVTVSGKLVYLAVSQMGIQIVDVTTLTQPRSVSSFNTGGSAQGIALVGNLVYVANGEVGLQIIDVTRAQLPKLLGGFKTVTPARAIAVSGHFAYVAVGQSGLEIIDISDRANPTRAAIYSTSGQAAGITIVGTLALSSTDAGLDIVDITNPATPKALGTLTSNPLLGAPAISFDSPPSPTAEDLILDCDPGNDVDDMGDLAVMHQLANLGELNILAIMYSMRPWFGAPDIEIANRFYGRPQIPIGVSKTSFWDAADYYGSIIATNFYNSIGSSANAPNAVTLYRQILASRPDHSVSVLTSGQLRNIFDLWHTSGDSDSPLSGPDLLAQKLKRLIVVAGIFPSGAEFNMYVDPTAASILNSITNSLPVTFVGIELGNNVLIGNTILTKPETDPIRMAYDAFYRAWHVSNRPAWTGLALLLAARGYTNGPTPLFTAIKGYVNVDPKIGTNTWTNDQFSNHEYLRLAQPISYYTSVIDDLLMRPPMANGTIRALVPKKSGGLQIVNITDPKTPSLEGNYDLPDIPRLQIAVNGTSITLAWPERFPDFTLESTADLSQSWKAITTAPVDVNSSHTVTVEVSESAFFRLHKP